MKNQSKRYLVTYSDTNVSKETAVKTLGVSKVNVKDGVVMMAADKAPSEKDILHFENLGISVLELTQKDAKELATKKGVLVVEEDTKVYALDSTQPKDYEPHEVYVNKAEMERYEKEVDNNLPFDSLSGQTLTKRSTSPLIVGDKDVPEAELLPLNTSQFGGEGKLQFDANQFGGKDILQDDTDELVKKDDSESEEGDFSAGYKKALVDMFSSMLDANTKTRASKSGSLGVAAQNAEVSAISASYIPWNIKMVKAPQAWAKGYDGYGVKVAVLDTGIDYNHPDLYVYGGANFTSNTNGYMDGHGHGTHCAGIIAAREYNGNIVGVAPRARLYAVKVLSDGGWGYTSWIIAGMEWCVNNGIKVASMSLGSSSSPSQAYANAVSRCQCNGVLVVTAAGNEYQTSFPWVGSPANSAKTNWWSTSPIAVGAVNSNNNIASFSSRGRKESPWNPVGCVAPGVSIRSTYLNNGFVSMSGTSMACPHVSGLAALLWEKWGNTSPYWIKKQILLGTYYSHGYTGSIAKGFGLIHCDKVVSTNYLNLKYDYFKQWYLLY